MMRMLAESMSGSALVRLAVAASLLAAIGCGRHRGLDEDDDDRDAGEDAGRGGAGRGGTGGRGGSGGTAGGATPMVKCGTKQCTAPANPLAALGLPSALACCADASQNACGVQASADVTCEPLASVDMRCPGVNLGVLGAFAGDAAAGLMTGCCIDNQCGLDGALFGRGCVEDSEASSLLTMIPLVGGLVQVPSARACDGTSQPSGDEDAGL